MSTEEQQEFKGRPEPWAMALVVVFLLAGTAALAGMIWALVAGKLDKLAIIGPGTFSLVCIPLFLLPLQYVLTADGLVLQRGAVRRLIPYGKISLNGEADGKITLKVEGQTKLMSVAPVDMEVFVKALTPRLEA